MKNKAVDRTTLMITTTAMMTALICVVGPLTLPIGPIPVSLCNLAIYLALYILDRHRSFLAVILYLLIGLIGLPVFSGFMGGPEKLFGPTGGYLIGYIALALIAGPVVDKFWKNKIVSILIMEAGTWVLYMMGTAWLAFQAGMTFQAALAAGVIPFILIDLAKIVVAAFLGPVLRMRLARYTNSDSSALEKEEAGKAAA